MALSRAYPYGPVTVTLMEVGAERERVAATLHKLTEWEAADVQALMDAAPVTLLRKVSVETATAVQTDLQAAGATVTVTGGGDKTAPLTGTAAPDVLADTAPLSDRATEEPPQTTAVPSSSPPPATPPAPGNVAGYSLRLLQAGQDKEGVIHVLHELTGLSLAETRALVDSLPRQVLKQVDPHTGRAVQKRLQSLGAVSELVWGMATSADPTVITPGSYNVILQDPGEAQAEVIRVLRDLLDERSLVEVKHIIEATPLLIFSGVSLKTAETIKIRLQAVDAVTRIVFGGQEQTAAGTKLHPDNSFFLFGDCHVLLQDPGPEPDRIVAILRDLLNYRTLEEVQDMAQDAPQIVVRAVPRATAETIKRRLEAVGAIVEITR